MSEQREALAEALFDAAFPGEREKDPYWYQAYEHDWYAQADRLLASDALARLLADAEQRGAAKVRFDRERHFALGKEAGRAEVAAAVGAVLREYDPCCPPEGCGCTKCDLVDDLRAALTPGAADRVRAEEGE